MALTKPQLYNVAAFDATQDFIFTFNVIGGSQVVGNRLTIRDNTTDEVVYQEVQTTYRFEHIVASNSLTMVRYTMLKLKQKIIKIIIVWFQIQFNFIVIQLQHLI